MRQVTLVYEMWVISHECVLGLYPSIIHIYVRIYIYICVNKNNNPVIIFTSQPCSSDITPPEAA
ncbi:hypothetical protein Hanom_Chr17g01570201 [Helianthus anomalus]